MPTTLRQKTSFGPGIYRGHKFTAERLKAFAEGTNKAIAAGIPIPLLKLHAPINASDTETVEFAKQEGAGWITRVDVESDGSLAWEAKDVPDDVAKQVKEGTARFTSPEFRDAYASEKVDLKSNLPVYAGNIIRHWGFTPKPGNPHQGEITADPSVAVEAAVALEEAPGAWQFDESEKKPLSQHAESTDEKNPRNDGSYKTADGDFPKHNEDAEDDKDHDVNTNMAAGSKDNSIDWDSLSDSEKSEVLDLIKKKRMAKQPTPATSTTNLTDNSPPVTQHDDFGAGDSKKKKRPADPSNPENDAEATPEAGDAEYEATPPTDLIIPESPPANQDPLTNNPDIPPAATDKSKLAAVVAGLAQFNVVLPSDFDISSDTAIDLLLTGINTAVKAKAENEAKEAEDKEESPPVTETSMPFSEEETQKFSAQFAGKEHHLGTFQPLNSNRKFQQFNHLVVHHGHGSVGVRGDNSGHFAVDPEHAQKFHEAADLFGFKHGKHYTMTNEAHKPNIDKQYEEHNQLQFSEDELKALSPKARAAIEAGQRALVIEREAKAKAETYTKAAQFAEAQAKNNAARDKVVTAISTAKIPPSLRVKLLSDLNPTEDGKSVIQFAEEKEQPVYTTAQVAEMVASAMPRSLQFLEEVLNTSQIEDSKSPPFRNITLGPDGKPIFGPNEPEQFFEEGDFIGPGHVSPERARELVGTNAYLAQTAAQIQPRLGVSEMVANETAKHPNQVMSTNFPGGRYNPANPRSNPLS